MPAPPDARRGQRSIARMNPGALGVRGVDLGEGALEVEDPLHRAERPIEDPRPNLEGVALQAPAGEEPVAPRPGEPGEVPDGHLAHRAQPLGVQRTERRSPPEHHLPGAVIHHLEGLERPGGAELLHHPRRVANLRRGEEPEGSLVRPGGEALAARAIAQRLAGEPPWPPGPAHHEPSQHDQRGHGEREHPPHRPRPACAHRPSARREVTPALTVSRRTLVQQTRARGRGRGREPPLRDLR